MPAIGVFTITIGDTLEPLNTILRDGEGEPIGLSSYTVKFAMEDDEGNEELAATTTGVTKEPTQEFTVDTSLDILKCVNHGVKENDQVVVASSGTLPAGLAASTRYFARDVTPNAFRVSLLPGAHYEDITGAGSGTHTFYLPGSVQVVFADAQVDTAGIFRGWFTRTDGSSDIGHHPDDGQRWYEIHVVARGA